jgi:hypothetical protein
MDRFKTNIAVSQLSFIDTIVRPSFEGLAILLPKIEENLEFLNSNRKKWEDLKEQYDKQLKELESKTTNNDNERVKLAIK